MKKTIKYGLGILVICFIGYNSVYFRKLSELKAAEKTFDAPAYVKDLIDNKMPTVLEKAVTLDYLFTQIKIAPANSFEQYGKVLTIGSSKFFMVRGTGEITAIDDATVEIKTVGNNQLKIATEYVFGNDIRDATGLVNLNDFTNTVDLSNISSEINKVIREKVIPPFKKVAKKGDQIEFFGAIELNQAHLSLVDVEMLPVSLKIIP